MFPVPAGEKKHIRILLIFTAAVTGLLISGALSHEIIGSKVEETNKMALSCKIGGEGWMDGEDACTLAACMGGYNCLTELYGNKLGALSVMNHVYKNHPEDAFPTDRYVQIDQNKCVESSVANIESNGFESKEAREAIDRDYNTKWTENGYGSFLQVDLGTPKRVCSLDVAWFNGHERIYNFVISTSNDGTTFTDILRGVSTGMTRAPENYDLLFSADGDARFVRITVFGNTESKGSDKSSSEASISEIKVFTDKST